MNLYSTFAPFSQRGLPSGAVETSCERCGETTISGLPDWDSLLDAVVWARAHKCPHAGRPDTRAGADRPDPADAEGTGAGERPPAEAAPFAPGSQPENQGT